LLSIGDMGEFALMSTIIGVNRAPVLTLWATIVAEQLGHPPETALTLGRFLAGSSARARRVGWARSTRRTRPMNVASTQPR
jgi:hypothetical protein